ncbi:protein FAM151B isoform X2 [Zonotrichia leucophrys gambelii]|uniref:protein FAM151B isoform X2 n=1 Tax=Zonotrichia leucophrys gambelii TaxID=257770 RepID=UPI003140B636
MASGARGAWSEWPVDHFLRTGHIAARDGAAVRWFHAANSRARAAEAARSDVHMVEVDVVLRGGDGDPILAHPPDTDSDITLQEWLAQMGSTSKGIKLDFKSLAAVGPSLELLGQLGQSLDRPVWLNGDILPGPCGNRAPLDARAFLGAVTSSCPDATLSLGWTTGCHRGQGSVCSVPSLCVPRLRVARGAGDAAPVPGAVPAGDVRGQGCAGARLRPAAAVAAAAVPQVQPHCLDRKGRCVFCRRLASHPRKF